MQAGAQSQTQSGVRWTSLRVSGGQVGHDSKIKPHTAGPVSLDEWSSFSLIFYESRWIPHVKHRGVKISLCCERNPSSVTASFKIKMIPHRFLKINIYLPFIVPHICPLWVSQSVCCPALISLVWERIHFDYADYNHLRNECLGVYSLYSSTLLCVSDKPWW